MKKSPGRQKKYKLILSFNKQGPGYKNSDFVMNFSHGPQNFYKLFPFNKATDIWKFYNVRTIATVLKPQS